MKFHSNNPVEDSAKGSGKGSLQGSSFSGLTMYRDFNHCNRGILKKFSLHNSLTKGIRRG